MTVKANQPTLQADLDLLFKRLPGPHQDLRMVQQTSKAHGRLETRTLWASADVKGYLDWPSVEQGLCLERRVVQLATGEISTERVYGLTSLAATQLDLAKILQRWRGHWGIENRLHWVKDVVLKEDASRVRTGQAPLILATLRNALVSCLRAVGFDSITQGRRHFALNLDEALAFICGSLV
jgi:Transposase DDE domain